MSYWNLKIGKLPIKIHIFPFCWNFGSSGSNGPTFPNGNNWLNWVAGAAFRQEMCSPIHRNPHFSLLSCTGPAVLILWTWMASETFVFEIPFVSSIRLLCFRRFILLIFSLCRMNFRHAWNINLLNDATRGKLTFDSSNFTINSGGNMWLDTFNPLG